MMKHFNRIQSRGFTTLFAVLVASLLLAVGLTIFDITYKEVVFSTVSRNSAYAIYAADAGAECGLYWDHSYQGSNASAFATSTTSSYQSSGIFCSGDGNGNAQDVTQNSGWLVTQAPAAATTTFQVNLGPYCAIVTVAKRGNPAATSIVSRGYNTACNSVSPSRIERAIEIDF